MLLGFSAAAPVIASLADPAFSLPPPPLHFLSVAFAARTSTERTSQRITTRLAANRKDKKKVSKLESSIPYHEGRGNKEEVEKIKEQIAAIWEKAREAAYA